MVVQGLKLRIRQPDQALLQPFVVGPGWPDGSIGPVPLASAHGLRIVILMTTGVPCHGMEAQCIAPFLQLACPGGVGLGEADHQIHHLDGRHLLGAPLAQLRLLVPELQKLIGGDELGFGEIGGAQVLEGLTLHKPEPTHKVADAMAFHSAPVPLGGQLRHAANTALGDQPDAVGAFAGGDQLFARSVAL